MLQDKERRARLKGIERVRLIRIENLRRLCEMHGSWTALGRLTGHSSSFYGQVAGPNPRRTIGEVLARDIEQCLGLPSGWLDMQR